MDNATFDFMLKRLEGMSGAEKLKFIFENKDLFALDDHRDGWIAIRCVGDSREHEFVMINATDAILDGMQ